MDARAFFAIGALATLLAGCTLDDSGPVRSVFRPANGAASQSPVFYLTDRAPDPAMPGGFANRWADAPSCGIADAALPPARVPGEEEKWGYVAKTKPLPCAAPGGMLAGLTNRIAAEAKAKNCRSVFLFVHGFHTGFDGAVLRAAQIAHDAQTDCVASAFAWTSAVKLDRYAVDLERSAYAQPLLAEFLRELSASGLRVTVLAHSVGARVSLGSLAALKYDRAPVRAGFIDELVLAAPDVGIEAGDDDFAKLLRDAAPFVKRTTVYASSNDTVLAVSRSAHGGVARAGGDPAAIAVDAIRAMALSRGPEGGPLSEFDVIDASAPPADSLDHSYFAMSYEAIYDMTIALRGVPLEDRLKPNGPWPATLVRSGDGRALATERGPRLITSLMIRLAPLLP